MSGVLVDGPRFAVGYNRVGEFFVVVDRLSGKEMFGTFLKRGSAARQAAKLEYDYRFPGWEHKLEEVK